MELQNLFTEVKKKTPLLRYGVPKLGPISQKKTRNVWENIGIRQSENLLQNNRTLLHLTHFTSFSATN